MIRILQISDIHWTKRKNWDADFPGMKARFLVDLKDYHKAKGSIDYVFVCGDVAFKGAKDEYDEAKEYIEKICKIVGCKDEQVFVVPGNHDLNRKAAGANIREMMNAALSCEGRNKDFFDESILKTTNLKESAYRAFEHYYEFSTRYLCQEAVMGKCLQSNGEEAITDDDKLYYHERLAKKEGTFNISVRGVNTALNCDEWDYNDEKNEGHRQFLPRRAYVMDEVKKQEIRIILGHHPLEFLTNKEEIEQYLNNHYHIQFFGHVHEQKVHEKNRLEGNFVRVYSGAFDPPKDKKAPERYKPIYNLVEIEQKDEGHIQVRGESQIWETNRFVKYDEGCFEKVIEIEQDKNKWEESAMTVNNPIDARSIKFKYMRLDNRTYYFDKISGVHFKPKTGRSETDNCLDFLAEVEKMGKLAELKDKM